MIVNADEADPLPLDEHYDACIAGGGVAGIIIAKTLVDRGQRVLLLEAGDLEYSSRSQAFYAGRSIGRAYFDLDSTRLRFLGGTSNHWAGWCRPLDPYDFEPHPHVSETGWPIGISDLQPYLEPARKILELDDFPQEQTLRDSAGYLKEIFFQQSPPVHFGSKYLDFMESSEYLSVFLNANLIDIEFDVDTGRAAKFIFRGYRADSPIYDAAADNFILALGGLENARLLLNVSQRTPPMLRNNNDCLGRFFMEHPHHFIGYYITDPIKTNFGAETRFLAPTRHMIGTENIGNCGLRVEPIFDPGEQSFIVNVKRGVKRLVCASEIVSDLVQTIGHFRCPAPAKSGVLNAHSEQIPNRNSRVTLTDDVDEFGLHRITLNWQLSPMDKKTMRRMGIAVGEYFARSDFGRVKLFDWVLSEDDDVPGLDQSEETGGNHHMGTTRMGISRADGVVDQDCRLFDVANLYVAGSSVFRTSGHANPTLTIVQLALRLADHLAAV